MIYRRRNEGGARGEVRGEKKTAEMRAKRKEMLILIYAHRIICPRIECPHLNNNVNLILILPSLGPLPSPLPDTLPSPLPLPSARNASVYQEKLLK